MLDSLSRAANGVLASAHYDASQHRNVQTQQNLAAAFSKILNDSGLLTEDSALKLNLACGACSFGPDILPESQKILQIAQLFKDAASGGDPVSPQQIQDILDRA